MNPHNTVTKKRRRREKKKEGIKRCGAHLVLVAIVGLEESFSKPVQLPEARNHPHTLEVRGQIDHHMIQH